MAYKLSIVLPIIITLLIFCRILLVGRRPSSCPPGPPTWPILGNIHLVRLKYHSLLPFVLVVIAANLSRYSQLSAREPHKQFAQWVQQYGSIFSLMLGSKMMVVLSSPEVVKELLDRQSAVTSSRQDLYIAQELGSGGQRMLLMVGNYKSIVFTLLSVLLE
jgi:hypothetical protein